jgi:hypothetical protein
MLARRSFYPERQDPLEVHMFSPDQRKTTSGTILLCNECENARLIQ